MRQPANLALWIAVALCTPLATGCADAPRVVAENPETGFGLYRSGRLSPADLKLLCDAGVTEILILDGEAGERECRLRESICPDMRVRYDYAQEEDHPVSAEFLGAFDDWISEAQAEGRKVAFRCRHGWHRTGRLAAYYRIRFEGATAAEASREMHEIGSMMWRHPSLGPQVEAYSDLVAGEPCSVDPASCPIAEPDPGLSAGRFLEDVCEPPTAVEESAAAQSESPRPPLDPDKPISDYVREAWSIDDGLPSNAILDITQTRDGYLWLATTGGLARFDGHRFTVYDASNTPALESNVADLLLESSDGALWIGSPGGGLVRRQAESFDLFSTEHGLGGAVTSLAEDADGTIWIAAGGRLQQFRDGRIVDVPVVDSIGPLSVRRMSGGAGGAVWFTSDRGAFRYHDGELARLPLDHLGADLRTIHVQESGEVWIEAVGNGLIRIAAERTLLYDASSGFEAPLADRQSGPWARRALLRDVHGAIWFGGRGLYRGAVDGEGAVFTGVEGLSDERVRSLYQDDRGDLWIGTWSGLNRLRDGPIVSRNVTRPAPRGIIEDDVGTVWLGTSTGVLRQRGDGWSVLTPLPSAAPPFTYVLAPDPSGRVWVGTRTGLFLYGSATGRRLPTPPGLESERVSGAHVGPSGTLWVATTGVTDAQLHRLEDDRFHSVASASIEPWWVHEDRSGRLWIGARQGLFELRDGDIVPAFESQTTGVAIETVFEDDAGTLWFAGNGRGLLRVRGGELAVFGVRDGLPDNMIVGIIDDGGDHLWMSTDYGLFTLRKSDLEAYESGETDRVRTLEYGGADGMQEVEASGVGHPAATRLSDGTLAFATVTGFAVVDPARAAATGSSPIPATVEEVLVDGERTTLPSGTRLAAGQRQIEFRFGAIALRRPGDVRLRYRLVGYDDDWVFAGGERRARYTNLPPGRYEFRVQAGNALGEWGTSGPAAAFSIPPFVWETLWFRLGILLLVAELVRRGYRLRSRRIRARNVFLEKQIEERARSEAQLQRTIQERNAAEAAIRSSEALVAGTMDSLTEHVAVIDRSGTILRVNEGWKAFGAANGAPVSVLDGVGLNYLDACRKASAAGDPHAHRCLAGLESVLRGERQEFDLEYPCPSPTTDRWFSMRAVSLKGADPGAVVTHLDITMRRRTEERNALLREQLAHVSRVTTMGVMAAAIAHEINSPLEAIVSNAQAGRRLLPDDDANVAEAREALTDIADQGMRAGEVIRRLRKFLTRGEGRREPLRVRDVILEVLALVRAELGESRIDVDLDLPDDLPEVLGDRVQLQQVLLNLMLNARTAMFSNGTAERRLSLRARLADDGYLETALADTGPGISPDVIDRIFEPFVSTHDDGMGLGLSISEAIIDAHGGTLRAANAHGGGAVFVIRLPTTNLAEE